MPQVGNMAGTLEQLVLFTASQYILWIWDIRERWNVFAPDRLGYPRRFIDSNLKLNGDTTSKFTLLKWYFLFKTKVE